MKTLADLRREAQTGTLALEMVERFGSTEIIPRLQGIRPIIKVNTVCFTLKNMDGEPSRLDIEKASLTEYDGETLTIYNPAERPLNEQEAAIMEKARKARKDYESQYNGNVDGYWTYKSVLKNSPCQYLAGEKSKGCRYDCGKNVIHDDSMKGEPILKYRVHKLEPDHQLTLEEFLKGA